jgi:hypothetical protein
MNKEGVLDSLDVFLYYGNTEVARRLRRTLHLFLVSRARTASFARQTVHKSDDVDVSESSLPFCDMLRSIKFHITEVCSLHIK